MKDPELFDVIELLIDLPAHSLSAGDSRSETLRERGAICEEYDNSQYEIEFTNSDGESIALVALSLAKPLGTRIDTFIVVWRSASKTWVPIAEKIQAIVSTLPEENLSKVFDFARSVHNERISV
jgi:Domain of unknown function (DUF4926)